MKFSWKHKINADFVTWKSILGECADKRRKTHGGYRKSKKRKTRRKNKAKRGTKKKK